MTAGVCLSNVSQQKNLSIHTFARGMSKVSIDPNPVSEFKFQIRDLEFKIPIQSLHL